MNASYIYNGMNVIAIQRNTIRVVKEQRQQAVSVFVVNLEWTITLVGLLMRRLMKVMKVMKYLDSSALLVMYVCICVK